MNSVNFLNVNKGRIVRSMILAVVICFAVTAFSYKPINIADKANISGCTVKVTATSEYSVGNVQIIVFQVKIKGGFWETKIPPMAYIIETGVPFSSDVNLDFGCDVERRYKVQYQVANEHMTGPKSKVIYIPSSTGWTKDTSVDLGDVARFFKK